MLLRPSFLRVLPQLLLMLLLLYSDYVSGIQHHERRGCGSISLDMELASGPVIPNNSVCLPDPVFCTPRGLGLGAKQL